jgi:hypothetical protein
MMLSFPAPSRAAPSAAAPPDSVLSAGPLLVAAALLAQGLALARLSGDAAALAVFVPAALAGAFARARHARWPRLDFLVVTVAFGGVGMLAGMALEGGPAAHAHAAHTATVAAGAWSAATGLMLLACVPACLRMCAPLHAGGRVGHVASHLLLALGMAAGMAAAGPVLGPPLARVLGPLSGMHAAMLLGMTAGTSLSLGALALLPRAAASASAAHLHARSAAP